MVTTDALELRAWRYLAAHRVGKLHVTHVSFIDDGDVCRMNTPSCLEYYEHGEGQTFSEAAIGLALALGMQCEDDSDSTASASDQDSSSASTATHRSGESEKTSPPADSAPAGSTTAATGAARDFDESAGQHSDQGAPHE